MKSGVGHNKILPRLGKFRVHGMTDVIEHDAATLIKPRQHVTHLESRQPSRDPRQR
jgi:hypothetical protein